MTEVNEATVAAPAIADPKPTKTTKQTNAERIAKLKEAKAAKTAKAGTAATPGVDGAVADPTVPKRVREKAVKTPKPCRCGCGGQTNAFFVPGHDAKFKGWLLNVERGKMKVEQLPETVQASYTWVPKGDGFIPTTDYRGNPHTGYESVSEA